MKNDKPYRRSRGAAVRKAVVPSTAVANIAAGALFAAVAVLVMAVGCADYLRITELLSIFLPTGEFFADCCSQPGGLLAWLSAFAVQSFYHPLFGAFVYTALLVGIWLLSARASGLPARYLPLLLVVPAFTLLAYLDLGYLIFSLKTPGHPFLMPIGLVVALAAAWGCRCIPLWWLRAAAVLAVAAGGYCLAGFYGLFSAAVCAASEISGIIGAKGRGDLLRLVPAAIAVLCIWLVPKFLFAAVGGDLPMSRLYTCGLPWFYAGEESLRTPYLVVTAVIVLCALFSSLLGRVGRSWPFAVVSWIVAVASAASVQVCRYNDANFNLTLALDNALMHGRWAEAVEIAEAAGDIEPTRVNVMLTDIALLRSGQLADRAFTFPIASAPYATTRNVRATHDVASRIFSYHTGLVNYAYRWAMEYKVEYGLNVEQLMFMAKCAILNGDMDIARKCLDNLELTANHREFARKYRACVDNPELIADDPELSAIRRLMPVREGFIHDHNHLEEYVWREISEAEIHDIEALELSLMAALIRQDIQLFGSRIEEYARHRRQLPLHFQEAILVWSSINDDFDYRPFPIDQAVVDRFNAFIDAESRLSGMADQARAELLRPVFGDTFWFYYLYTNNLTIV